MAHSFEARLRRGMAMAAAWGLASEGELYGHVCFYRRECQQYYEKCRRYWDEEVAGGLIEDDAKGIRTHAGPSLWLIRPTP